MKRKPPAFIVAYLIVSVVGVGLAVVLAMADPEPGVTRLGSEPGSDTGHSVAYQVSATGSANEPVKITYSGPDGDNVDDESPGYVPVWARTVTTDPELYGVSLTAYGSSSDLTFRLTCSISIDGIEVARRSSTFSCSEQFDLKDFAEAEARATPTPTVTPTVTATAAPGGSAGPTTSRVCRYVTGSELTEIVSRAAGVTKPVQSVRGNGNKCTQVIDRDLSSVSFEVQRHGDPGGPPLGTRVRSIKERAYFVDYGGTIGELRVSLPGGDVFVVSVFFQALQADVRDVAVATYKAARPRLLKTR